MKNHMYWMNKEIQKYGGYKKVAEICEIPYRDYKPLRKYLKSEYFKIELLNYLKKIKSKKKIIPTYRELRAHGEDNLATALGL